jgi:trehalose-phosphatase
MKLKIKGINAVIFDMDGVITKTATLHEKAWKRMFDAFLKLRKMEAWPFSNEDYLTYVDGKPRYDGVESFLKSRRIELPYGNPSDPPDEETICGLGNRKNQYFMEIMENEGVEVYEDTINQLIRWKQEGIKTAVISSSKNCEMMLEKAGVLHLFDARVDGEVSEQLGLKGKPAPDIFNEAALRIEANKNHTVVFEDAESGVQAGKAGGFKYVIGVKRKGNKKELLLHGADWALRNLYEIEITNDDTKTTFTQELPSALYERNHLFFRMGNKKPAIFFDYDGTLTPIVSQPEDAILDDEMRETVKKTATHFPVAIVSGRDTNDIKELVNLDELVYAGSHGYHIIGPDNLYLEHEEAQAILPLLDQLEKSLKMELKPQIKGSKIDRKKYAIAVHYRNVEDGDVKKLKEYVKETVANDNRLKLGKGKKVLEIKPSIDWHKGKAVHWLLDRLNLDNGNNIPIYFGDDVTDEDAFREIIDDGIGIIIGEHDHPTAAHYSLKDEKEVALFLSYLIEKPQQ